MTYRDDREAALSIPFALVLTLIGAIGAVIMNAAGACRSDDPVALLAELAKRCPGAKVEG